MEPRDLRVSVRYETVEEWRSVRFRIEFQLPTAGVPEATIRAWLREHWHEIQQQAPAPPAPSTAPVYSDYGESRWTNPPRAGVVFPDARRVAFRDLDIQIEQFRGYVEISATAQER